ncbi:hypothetical protein GXM_07380 [Nostoc sphaeroides CCNUC1]|uniref:Uncharacterized protein n=1 Tax=Nostoc sphaeroides CCNUC1 TaxID=2653204 RepID=A0A5P8WCI2_9NOSO|nr:hypothetical protein GXM_07380 [Nostoc sphaeroides CCNUC1]
MVTGDKLSPKHKGDRLLLTKVKNQRKNQHFAFDLFSKLQSDVYDGLRLR